MELYEKLEIEIIALEPEDVVTASGGNLGDETSIIILPDVPIQPYKP